jgi:hypothetical protein
MWLAILLSGFLMGQSGLVATAQNFRKPTIAGGMADSTWRLLRIENAY